MVINTERLRVRDGKPKENVMVFKVVSRDKEELGDGDRPFCTHCNHMGNWKKGCYQIIGFSEGWDENRKGRRGRGRGGSSTRGGKGGYGRGNTLSSGSLAAARANAVQGGRIPALGVHHPHKQIPLKALVLWIVDTGASNHVTNDISLMRNVKTIQNCPVGLPDGQTVNVNQLGSVTLDGGLDQLTRTVIGVGGEKRWTLFFPRCAASEGASKDCEVDLWHQRMGHPSEKVLKLLPPVSNFVRKNKSVCDVCPRAKQTRDSFPLSENNASSLFELVHIDLWDPYKVPSSCGARLIKIVRSDNGTEFNHLQDYFGRLPIKFWGECALTACYFINRTPSSVIQNKTPYEMLFGKIPSYDSIRGWQLFDLETKEYFVSRDVQFHERVYPFGEFVEDNSGNSTIVNMDEFVVGDEFDAWHGGDLMGVNYIVAVTEARIPRSYKEAMQHTGWRDAMASEIKALEDQGTWSLEKLPEGKKALGSKWVYTEKRDEEGKLLRLKVRLVVFGNHQEEGIDYNETFSLVAKMSTLSFLIYVDDMMIAGNNTFALESFKAYLSECFKMKDLGALKYFLGLEVARSKHGFYVCQRKYALDIISETGLLGAKSVDFLMEQNHKLALAEGKEFADGEQYRRLISRLIYLAVTRPGLAYSKTKKQHTVSTSSTEAEYRSMARLTCELKWLKQLLRALGVEHKQGMNMYCDSQSTLHIANNLVFHERTKHIEVDCHLIRDAIKEGVIKPSYVSTKIQLADIFTKALGKAQFKFFLDKMGIRDLHAPS
ncbi:uncharacterized protein LOC110697676 [Chenopodium quinoa]|uniref:uncharacterized protein LOC110697676 n=1 Tax=Chenopodium quinoa TaxID=63459 RepID=UPI000B78B5AB|nr:uncharacterized protein LOC110697676 [Chenopodium quinoa]